MKEYQRKNKLKAFTEKREITYNEPLGWPLTHWQHQLKEAKQQWENNCNGLRKNRSWNSRFQARMKFKCFWYLKLKSVCHQYTFTKINCERHISGMRKMISECRFDTHTQKHLVKNLI